MSNECQLLRYYDSDFLEIDVEYSPDQLRKVADDMDKLGILTICIEYDEWDKGGVGFAVTRRETQEELDKRIRQEAQIIADREKNSKDAKLRHRKAVITEAKKLGMVFPGE
jgi:hypothetical protein